MKRYSKSDFEFLDVLTSGTAAAFLGRNKVTGKKGIFKDNGCMLGIQNDDVREKLASQIITEIEEKCAQIDLVYDEELRQNACFSNYILNDDERLIRPDGDYYNDIDVINYIPNYIEAVKKINDNPSFLKKVRQDLCKYIYMSCILDSYDVQTEIIQNQKTGETRVAPWFDFGVAFIEDGYHRKGFFSNSSSDEVLKKLFDNYFDDISDISGNVNRILTSKKIDELFYQDYVVEAFEKNELENMKKRFISQVEKSDELRKEKIAQKEQVRMEQISENEKKSSFFSRLKQKIVGLKNIFTGRKMLSVSDDEERRHEKTMYLDSLEGKKSDLQKECRSLTNDISEIVIGKNKTESMNKKIEEINKEI